MSLDPELDAMSKVIAALSSLDEASQVRVLKWATEKLGVGGSVSLAWAGAVVSAGSATSSQLGNIDLSQVAAIWMKQFDVSTTDIESVFHVQGDDVEVIATGIPGKNNKERVLNCYVLAGAREILKSGATTFTDKEARSLCEAFGCLDTTNHAKYLSDKGNEFSGSKDKGWSLTTPGKKRAAALVKELAGSAG